MNYNEVFRQMDFDVYERFPWKYGNPRHTSFNPYDVWKKLDVHRNNLSGASALFSRRGINVGYEPNPVDFTGAFLYECGDQGRVNVWVTKRLNDRVVREFGDKRWNRVKFKLIQTALHETVHRMQYLNEGERFDDYQYPHPNNKSGDSDYLSYKCETQAWAHCAYMEYMLYRSDHPGSSVDDLIQMFLKRKPSWSEAKNISEAVFMYVNNFSVDSAPMKSFLREMHRWDRMYVRLNK